MLRRLALAFPILIAQHYLAEAQQGPQAETKQFTSANEFIKNYDKKGRALDAVLVMGIGRGIAAYNAAAPIEGGKSLYCPPDKLVLTHSQSMNILRQYIKDLPESGEWPLEVVILGSLQHTFPCR
jgi:hypothetical protein